MFILSGDVNIHLDTDDIYARQLNDIFQMFNLKQHVNFPTHKHGHTIDVVVTYCDSPVIKDITQNNVNLSNHFIVQFMAQTIMPMKKEYKFIKYRDI